MDHVAQELAEAHAAASAPWPIERSAGRAEDMGPGHLRLVLDNDNDVCVEVWDGKRSACVEFCNPGGGGGGRSSRTRMALIVDGRHRSGQRRDPSASAAPLTPRRPYRLAALTSSRAGSEA